VVFTNGVFDVMHRGHTTYLAAARARGDVLVVGLNTDASVRRLGKGPGRPINRENDRAAVVAALECVDAVCLFDDDTPLTLVEALLPDVLVKGGDYARSEVVGRDAVEAGGGRVELIPFLDGYSTSGLVARIKGVEP
jgi:D-beta-D-heptose 7-phosphate kinase/D-beta-D-heptose 1-phosphate adenosyltransferase